MASIGWLLRLGGLGLGVCSISICLLVRARRHEYNILTLVQLPIFLWCVPKLLLHPRAVRSQSIWHRSYFDHC